MKILVFGGDGMLGHQLLLRFQHLAETKVTLRQELQEYVSYQMFNRCNSIDNIDVRNFDKIVKVLETEKPTVVINAIGIVKQRSDSKEIIPSVEINTLFPHKLASICSILGSRLIHISTDCVFSGKDGMYTEQSESDATDIYGKTKYLGEVSAVNCLTLRTSIIGRELSRHKSLFEWFLAQNEKISGYTNAIFSGFTTVELARILEKVIFEYPHLSGVFNVSSDPINKYDLLRIIASEFNHKIEIIPDSKFKCDRSLDSTLFRKSCNYTPPSWESMISELKSLP
jgi:dTDP-4-dehydrorhamnose reductase